MTALEQYQKQHALMKKVLGGKTLKGEDVATLLEETIKIVEKNQLFERDIITGKLRSLALTTTKDHFIEQQQAKNLFKTFFCDKLFVVKKSETGSRLTPLSDENQTILFNQIIDFCTYNSRKEIYDRIPKWDGVERVKTFMRDYFKCDANPNFFLLFLTYLIGKIDNPETCRVEHWFDFVSESKGTGKTTFFKHLLQGIGCADNAFLCSAKKRSLDDFWTELYNANAMIAVDDECKLLETISYDDWKSIVTMEKDTFSRKFAQPETHWRPFIFVRTSNHPKTVFSLNERRQIIFNINLPEHTVLHWQLDDNYMVQMLAEAKNYYEKNGVYELTEAEKEEILDQNLENTSTETPEYHMVEKFVEFLDEHRTDAKWFCDISKEPAEGYLWSSWSKFVDWANENKVKLGNLHYGNIFWKNMEVYARKNKAFVWSKNNSCKTIKNRSTVRVFGIRKNSDEVAAEETPDLPF